jgi:hypothetical protein
MGVLSLVIVCVAAIVLLFLYLTARTRPLLSFLVAVASMLLMGIGVVGIALSVDVPKPAIAYDREMLERLQKIAFKIPNLEDRQSDDYELLNGVLERRPDEKWDERQQHPRGREVKFTHERKEIIAGRITYQRDGTVELYVDFPERKICWRETTVGHYRCPYAMVSFE